MFGLARNLMTSLRSVQAPSSMLSASTFGMFKRYTHEFAPRVNRIGKAMKGRVPVRIGGSVKGNSVEVGKLGLRLKSKGLRIAANQLKAADKVLKRELRPTKSELIPRFCCNIAVCVKGNQTRMGKGKGAFHHWAARIPTGKVLFEIRGDIHDRTAREALRKAADKLPGLYEIITPESKVRVGLNTLIDKPAPVDYLAKMNENPTKKWLNFQARKTDPMYKLYSVSIDLELFIIPLLTRNLLEVEFETHSQELINIENKVALLEDIITELDTWSKELEHRVDNAVKN
ncbi:54S ribosomal protein L16 mitochondrial [Spathaspora sp. JA1]|nr:54S ribosomal protein L16 mitochondrial [Spathaspora sp. JA1]